MIPRTTSVALVLSALLLAPASVTASDTDDTRADHTSTATSAPAQTTTDDDYDLRLTAREPTAGNGQEIIRVATPGEIRIYPAF